MEPRFQPLQPERYVKKHIVSVRPHKFGVAGRMIQRQKYLLRAAELYATAQIETDQARKSELENLARAYLRLAEQSERNSHADVVYETPPKKDRDQA